MPAVYYTLVQHTGWTVGNKIGFRRATEPRFLSSNKEVKGVIRAGGMIYSSYKEADKASKVYNYPPEVNGVYPHCKGDFKTVRGLEEPVYIPA